MDNDEFEVPGDEEIDNFFSFWDSCSRLESAVYNLIEGGIKQETILKLVVGAFEQYQRINGLREEGI